MLSPYNTDHDQLALMVRYFEDAIHDMKTPFSIIYSIIQSLESREDLPSDAVSQIDKMKRACEKITGLIQDVSDSGKLAAGKFYPRYVNYDIVLLAESITQSVAPLAGRKNIDIIFDTNVEEKAMAVDKEIFERIMMNLLSNAIKFSPADSRVDVLLLDYGSMIAVEVCDNGCGISVERAASVFGRYETDRSPMNTDGVGLGLHIVQELVRAMNGDINIRKKISGSGTIMHFELPAVTVEEELPERLVYSKTQAEGHVLQIGLSDTI